MRNILAGLCLVVAAWLSYSYLNRAPAQPDLPPAATAPAPESPRAPLPVAAKPAPKKMKGVFRPRTSGEAPSGNVIPFRVENGIAIAYGDLILGEPEDPQMTEGFYEASAPTLWERPEIPYAINNELPQPERVKQAVEYFNKHTPVTFVPYDGHETDAVVFEPGKENCYSLLGKQGGLQPIKLAPDCGWLEIAHEMMHVLGFVHEQSRPDRDRYLEILWPNIEEKFHDQFAIVPETFMEAERQGVFDYHSIMLYPPTIFSKNGEVTMRSRTGEPIRPLTDGLSPGDIEKLRELYRP